VCRTCTAACGTHTPAIWFWPGDLLLDEKFWMEDLSVVWKVLIIKYLQCFEAQCCDWNVMTRVQTSLRSTDQGADTIVWLALQPNSSLQNGAFYFDRAVAPKHLKGFRTGYTNEKVSAVVSKIGSLCGLNHISKSQ
jgi:hypothetical protein